MPRLLSVALTEQAVIDRRKTVTRRLGWWTDKNGRRLVQPGDDLCLVRKAMGRKRVDGTVEPLVRLATVPVVSVSRQPLFIENTPDEAAREGFPDWTWDEFLEFFCREMRCDRRRMITRIEWSWPPRMWLVTVGTAVALVDAPDAYQARWRVTRRLGVPIDGATAREPTDDEVARFRWAETLTGASRADRVHYLRREAP